MVGQSIQALGNAVSLTTTTPDDNSRWERSGRESSIRTDTDNVELDRYAHAASRDLVGENQSLLVVALCAWNSQACLNLRPCVCATTKTKASLSPNQFAAVVCVLVWRSCAKYVKLLHFSPPNPTNKQQSWKTANESVTRRVRLSFLVINSNKKRYQLTLTSLFFYYYTSDDKRRLLLFFRWLLVLGTNSQSKVSQLLLLAQCVKTKKKQNCWRKASVKFCINAVSSHEWMKFLVRDN